MKPLETGVYAGLLAVALVLSFATWKSEDDAGGSSDDSVVVFEPGGAGLTSVSWDGQKAVANLAIAGKGDDVEVWITAGKRAKIDAPAPAGDDDDSAGGEPAAKPEPTYGEPELKSFPGNDQSNKLVKLFSPLSALREFADLTPEDLAAMGLDEPKAEIAVAASSKTLTLLVGEKAYGSSDTYVQDKASSKVYLVSSKVIGPLRGAESRLMDRDLLGFEMTEAQAAKIASPAGGSVEARHQGTHDKDNAFWSTPDNTDDVDAGLDGFLKKVATVKASSFLTEADAPTGVEPVVTVFFVGASGPLATLDVARLLNADRSKPGEPVWDYFARTERTRKQWVKVGRTAGNDLAEELPGLMP